MNVLINDSFDYLLINELETKQKYFAFHYLDKLIGAIDTIALIVPTKQKIKDKLF